MDSVSHQLSVAFTDLRAEGALEEQWQVLVRIQAVFSVHTRGVIILYDPYFNIVEFAVAVTKWLHDRTADFSFATIDSEDTDILFLRPESDRWRIGSSWGSVGGVLVDGLELFDELNRFIYRLTLDCRQRLSIDIRSLLQPSPTKQSLDE
jgi:hypothetical protein